MKTTWRGAWLVIGIIAVMAGGSVGCERFERLEAPASAAGLGAAVPVAPEIDLTRIDDLEQQILALQDELAASQDTSEEEALQAKIDELQAKIDGLQQVVDKLATPPVCVPDCAGKKKGEDDGCGGACEFQKLEMIDPSIREALFPQGETISASAWKKFREFQRTVSLGDTVFCPLDPDWIPVEERDSTIPGCKKFGRDQIAKGEWALPFLCGDGTVDQVIDGAKMYTSASYVTGMSFRCGEFENDGSGNLSIVDADPLYVDILSSYAEAYLNDRGRLALDEKKCGDNQVVTGVTATSSPLGYTSIALTCSTINPGAAGTEQDPVIAASTDPLAFGQITTKSYSLKCPAGYVLIGVDSHLSANQNDYPIGPKNIRCAQVKVGGKAVGF